MAKKIRRAFTIGKVAEICSVSSKTVQKWFDNGHINGYRLPGKGNRLVPLTELVSFMKKNKIPLEFLEETVFVKDAALYREPKLDTEGKKV